MPIQWCSLLVSTPNISQKLRTKPKTKKPRVSSWSTKRRVFIFLDELSLAADPKTLGRKSVWNMRKYNNDSDMRDPPLPIKGTPVFFLSQQHTGSEVQKILLGNFWNSEISRNFSFSFKKSCFIFKNCNIWIMKD